MTRAFVLSRAALEPVPFDVWKAEDTTLGLRNVNSRIKKVLAYKTKANPCIHLALRCACADVVDARKNPGGH